MAIELGVIVYKHLVNQSRYKINTEQWGVKLLSINWKFILKIWAFPNMEVKGETPEKAEII
jgi:hypothetical protein